MGKGRKQYKVVSASPDIDQADLMNMFHQLAGDPSKLDPDIVQDKYKRLRHDIIRCNKLLIKFKEAILDRLHTKVGNDIYFDREVSRLVDFIKQVDEYIDESNLTEENLVHIYQALKDSFVVEEYLKVCKALKQGEECIKDRCSLSDRFILRAIGEEFYVFDFARINFKHLFTHILEENFPEKDELDGCKKYILVMCNMLYITTQDIYNIVTSPDVDIDKLSELIVRAISAAKKQVPRCGKAFRLIENSVDMLKNGMSGYYKDFVASGNPTIIFENFINDISSDLHIDTQTLGQFKRIIMHFRKQANSIPQKHTKLEGVFSTLDKIMEIMDNGKEKSADETDDETTDSEPDKVVDPDLDSVLDRLHELEPEPPSDLEIVDETKYVFIEEEIVLEEKPKNKCNEKKKIAKTRNATKKLKN